MNQELFKSLEQESDDKLFYNFKHDGNINFERKIVSGKILANRNYDPNKLKEEKEKIVKSIQDQINKYKDLENLKTKNKQEARKSILNSITPALVIFFLYLFDFIKDENPVKSDYYILFSIVAVLFLIVLFKIVHFKKKVNQLIESDINDSNLLENRLSIIDQEWDF